MSDIVLILGSGPNVVLSRQWPRAAFDRIVAINNAWAVRNDWDDLIFPEDFPADRQPADIALEQRLIKADEFVPAQNAFGGFVYAGGTMAFTAGYWALHALKPKVLAFMGCDMTYPKCGPTHYYGTGTADPLRDDPTLQDLGAKSARLALLAALEGCACVNLSSDASALLFDRATVEELPLITAAPEGVRDLVAPVLKQEESLGYYAPDGRYWEPQHTFDARALAALDTSWRSAWGSRQGGLAFKAA